MDYPSAVSAPMLTPGNKLMARFLLLAVVLFGCSSSFAEALKVIVSGADGQPVTRAAVLVRPIDSVDSVSVVATTEEMQQIKAAFVPDAIIITRGSAVNFPNFDRTRHHVYSFSEARQFELKLYKGTPAQPVVFDSTGVVALGCNIHDWMYGLIYVVDTPYSALTDDNGVATISNLALAQYQIEVLHPLIRATDSADMPLVEVTDNESATAIAVNVDLLDAPPRPARPAHLGSRE